MRLGLLLLNKPEILPLFYGQLPGAHSGEVTPGPIPNPAVKLPSAYDTGRASGRESWSVPGIKFLFPSISLT
ncbi:hypothetical protein HG1285_09676 [Hydrogenivirga sp. 128-5-R1-1]|nr:hypothetical protein HG1285_09676 [Hydrogenivirga sp. 128-5-R1-1]